MVSLVVRGAERPRLSRDSRIAHRARRRVVATRMHGMRCAAWYAHVVRACARVRPVRTPSPRASLA
ncbi:hypothetical protein C6Q05_10725 [Burkholderia multivorans]|nr:hypothetical protein C6Q05_10725 [Burkholderia multivorans]